MPSDPAKMRAGIRSILELEEKRNAALETLATNAKLWARQEECYGYDSASSWLLEELKSSAIAFEAADRESRGEG